MKHTGITRTANLRALSALLLAAFVSLPAQKPAEWKDPSPHTVSFVTADKDVRIEVLDWGGSGRTLVLLAGLGNTAHVFDDFAPKLSSSYHVVGITRRGFGASTIADSGYDANRLGDDVLAVLDSLHLDRPVLAGHSIAGEELSSIGSRYPGRVAGLIYLDAAYQYAFDNGKVTAMAELQKLGSSLPPPPPASPSDRASYAAIGDWFARVRGFRIPEADFHETNRPNSEGNPGKPRTPPSIGQMVREGTTKFSQIDVPVLALCAMPQRPPQAGSQERTEDARAAIEAYSLRFNAAKEKQLEAFEAGIPHSRVVRVPNADHYVFITNEAEVLREMRAFLAKLK